MNLWQHYEQFVELMSLFSQGRENRERFYHFLAPRNFGKIAFLEAFARELDSRPHPCIIVECLPENAPLSAKKFWHFLPSSKPEWQRKIDTLKTDLAACEEKEAAALVCNELSQWKKENDALELVIILPDYLDYEKSDKEWIFLQVVTLLEEADLQPLYFATSQKSIFKTLDLEEYWHPVRNKFAEIELRPFSENKLVDLAKKSCLDLEKFSSFWEETQGVPRKVVAQFSSIPQAQEPDLEKVDVADLLVSLSEEEFCWIILAAYLGKVNKDDLAIKENPFGAADGHRFLKGQGIIPIQVSDGKTWIDDAYAESIRAWLSKTDEARHKRLKEVAKVVNAVHLSFPDPDSRVIVCLLSKLNVFTTAIIEKIIPEYKKKIQTLIRLHPEYFDRQGDTFSVKKKYKDILVSYPDLREVPYIDTLTQQAKILWEKELSHLQEKINDYEKKLESEKIEEKKNLEEVQHIIQQIKEAEHKHVSSFKKEWKSKQFRIEVTKVKRSIVIPLFLMLIGAGSFYFGMIFFKQLSWPYLLAGAIFIGMGLWQSSESKEKVRKVAVPLDENELHRSIAQDEFIALLNLKKDALFHQKRFIKSRIERYRNELTLYQSRLQQPYV